MNFDAKARLHRIKLDWNKLTSRFNQISFDAKFPNIEEFNDHLVCESFQKQIEEINELSQQITVLGQCYIDLIRFPDIMTLKEFLAKLHQHTGSRDSYRNYLLLFDYDWSAVSNISKYDLNSLALHHGPPIKLTSLVNKIDTILKANKGDVISAYAPLWVGECEPRRAVTNLVFKYELDQKYFTILTKEI